MSKRFKSTAVRGIGKTRSGSPTIGLQTLIDRTMEQTKRAAFFDELRWKIAEEDDGEVSPDEALHAARILSRPKAVMVRKHVERGLVPAALAPGIAATSRGVKAFVDAKRGRGASAMRAVKDTTKGGVLADMVRGGLVGSGISLGTHGLRKQRARETYEKFIRQAKKDEAA